MPQPLTLVLVEKNCDLKSLSVKDYKEDELFKKCGFKKADGFSKQIDWPIKMDGQKYIISMYGKTDGKANMENKYDFPPPIDNKLFFGCCVLVGQIRDNNKKTFINLSIELWNKIYDKLFGGFEDLTPTNSKNSKTNDDNDDNDIDDNDEDNNEDDDELAVISKTKKTKQTGYLKDGFVVDDDDNNENDDDDDNSSDSDSLDDDDNNENNVNEMTGDDGFILEDIGSELSEDEYDYN
jgi:hypothetical protein